MTDHDTYYTSAAGLQMTTLPNGVRVVTDEVPHARSVAVGVWIDSGSRNDEPALQGAHHLLEHVVFKGTERFSGRAIAESLESVGGFLNAMTDREHTCYYGRCLPGHLPLALDVLASLVQEPTIDPDELEREKGVVHDEIDMYDDLPEERLLDLVFASAYGADSPLGHPVLGTHASVEATEADDLHRLVTERYVAEKTIVSVAGPMAHADVLAVCESAFGAMRTGGAVGGAAGGAAGERETANWLGEELSAGYGGRQAHVALVMPGLAADNSARHALRLIGSVLGGGMSGRLQQQIREELGLCYSIFTFDEVFADGGLFGVYFATDAERVAQVIDRVEAEFTRLQHEPLTPDELERAREQSCGQLVLASERLSERMMRAAYSVATYGRPRPLEETLESIRRVTPEQIAARAQRLFDSECQHRVAMHPS